MTEDTQRVDPLRDHPPVSRNLIRNPISLIGLALAAVAFANIVLLVLIDVLASHSSPYIGILAYMVAPGFLVFGLILVPIGMVIERRRRLHAVGAPPHFPRLDLNNPAQRSTFAFVLSFVVIFALVSAVGSYKAYEFTDSVDFCGQLCHTVMHPEFTAYQASPHARVACVECHVGSGASWYVKSKLSGMRQVYYTALGTYPRPIPTPVQNLRPAQQTCEQCHWPRKFWGAQLKTFTHYGSDEQNTPRVIRMLIKTGGGDPSLGPGRGRHPLAHEHRQQGHLLRHRRTAAGDSLGAHRRQEWQGGRVRGERRLPHPGADRQGRQAPHGLHRLPQPSDPHLRAARCLRGPGDYRARHRCHAAVHQAAGRRRC